MATVIALAGLRDNHFRAARDLSGEEIERLEMHCAALRRYENDSMGLGQLSQEFVALEGLIERFIAELRSTRGSAIDPRFAHAVISHVQRHVMNYLGLFRAFDDHRCRPIGGSKRRRRDWPSRPRQEPRSLWAKRLQ